MTDKVDVIVVGAGPAGLTAAYALGKAGLNVILLERGEYPGAKNMMGGILFTTILGKLIPDFWKDAPLERKVTSRKFGLLSQDSEMSFTFNTFKHSEPPFNNTFTALRAKFDHWYSKKVEELGVMLLPGVVVDDFIWEKGSCKGVRTRLEEGDLFCDCVVLAEGASGLLAEKAGIKKKPSAHEMAVGVKEIIHLPREVIEDRFCLNPGEGAAIEYFGDAAKGMFGSGFIYTNQDSLSVGVVASIGDSSKAQIKNEELIEYFKGHPCIANLVRGGETGEYAAHLLPEYGYDGMPPLVKDGLLLVGDCAGLLNTSHFHEGTNLAMASGLMAAETIIEARQKGEFTLRTLSAYADRMKNSFVLKDMKKFRKFPKFFKSNPEFLAKYPKIFANLMAEYFAISELPKEQVEKNVFKKFREEIGILPFSRTMFSFVKGMGWF